MREPIGSMSAPSNILVNIGLNGNAVLNPVKSQ